jgi:hypothetical protein
MVVKGAYSMTILHLLSWASRNLHGEYYEEERILLKEIAVAKTSRINVSIS